LADKTCKLPEDGVRTAKHVGTIFNINFILLVCSGHNMALGLTHPLTETSTRNISWG